MSCTDKFCYNIGEELRKIRDTFEDHCVHAECTDVLLPREKEVMKEYISNEFLDRRTMELARCFVQNVIRSKRDRSIKQFAMVPRQSLTGRTNPERNILSGIKECENMGINAIASKALFMGSFATILKCNSSIFNLPTIKKLLNDSEWRFTTRFNTVQNEAIDQILEIFHNYIVGMNCGNPTRTWSPNIMYTYGLYASQCPNNKTRDFCTVLEKISTLPRLESVRDFILAGKLTPDLFLSMLAQIGFTLEIMQLHYGFVHFDLHLNNILLHPVFQGSSMSWSYLLYGNEYQLRNIQFLATMIDFGFSSFSPSLSTTGEIALDSTFIGMGKYQKYGFMDFMIPGCDLFLLLNDIRQLVLITLDPSSKHFILDPIVQAHHNAILDFIDHVFREIYQCPDLFIERKSPSTYTQDYRNYNVLLTKGAGVSPLGLLDRLSQSSVIKTTLKIDLPWTVQPRSLYLPAICKKKIPAFLADIMPNWKSIVSDDAFFRPVGLLDIDTVLQTLDSLIDLVKNKRILFEFDYRPLMISGGQVSEDALAFYTKLIMDPEGFYYGFFQNTLLFYNLMTRFLETYYYQYYKKDRAFMELFAVHNNKIITLLRHIQKPGYMSNIAGMVRFVQTIANLKKSVSKKFCCIASRQSIGELGQQMIQKQKSSTTSQSVDPSIYRIDQKQQQQQRYSLPQSQKTQSRQRQQRRQQQIGFSQSITPPESLQFPGSQSIFSPVRVQQRSSQQSFMIPQQRPSVQIPAPARAQQARPPQQPLVLPAPARAQQARPPQQPLVLPAPVRAQQRPPQQPPVRVQQQPMIIPAA